MLACLAAAVLFGAQTAHAQDPEHALADACRSRRRSPRQRSSAPRAIIDRSQPLYLQGDELDLRHGRQSRRRARQRRDLLQQLHPDRRPGRLRPAANTLTAVGNVVLKEPNGNIIRADRYTLTDDFRDGFVQSLSIVASRRHAHRSRARRAPRRQYRPCSPTARFTPCKSNDGMPPLWCISAATRDPRSAGRDHHLPGRAVRAVRRAGLLHALLRARRPVGEAQVRLPDAGVRRIGRHSATA